MNDIDETEDDFSLSEKGLGKDDYDEEGNIDEPSFDWNDLD